MKKTIKAIVLLVVLVIGVLGSTMVASASSSFGSYNISTSWTTVASSTEGFNCNVELSCTAFDVLRVDVRMLNKSGKVIWEEEKSCPPLGSRVYYCGSDVYKIQARVSSGKGVCYSSRTNKAPN